MAFPKKGFWGEGIGWEDRGEVGANAVGNKMIQYTACGFCDSRARVGLEKGVSFLFCPKCLRKIIKKK